MRPGIEDVVPVSHPNSLCGDRNCFHPCREMGVGDMGASLSCSRKKEKKKKKKQDLKSLPPLDAE